MVKLLKSNLAVWAEDCQLVTASFFSWSAGKVALQRSKDGLLRSILYKILCQSPDLIPYAFSSQWRTCNSGGLTSREPGNEFLTVLGLLAAFERVSAHLTTSKIRFCFFIDGLDEYDGKPSEILPLIELLKSYPNVKMCVSSRP